MSEGVEVINKLLISNYGLDINISLPKFRIVWSTSQFEKRFEKYQVYSETGAIFLREESGVYEVPKYPIYEDYWVLERLFPTFGNPYLEMVAKYSYEPIWFFGLGGSDRQPIWRAVKLLADHSLRGLGTYKSPQDLEREEEERIQKEKILIKEILSNDTTPLAFSLKHGCSIVVPEKWEDKNG